MWRIVKTTDSQHVGTIISHIEKGQVLTFEDGDVVAINQIFLSEDGNSIVAFGANYQIELVKE
jgi:hypothetical protein